MKNSFLGWFLFTPTWVICSLMEPGVPLFNLSCIKWHKVFTHIGPKEDKSTEVTQTTSQLCGF